VQVIPLNLCFKGDRNYLQGADIYNFICENIPNFVIRNIRAPFRLIIHRFAHNQCDMLLSLPEEVVNKPDNFFAELIFSSSRGRISGWLVETERSVTCRNPYNEEKIEKLCIVTDQSIRIKGDSGYSPIEVAVCMTKQLHYILYPSKDLWIFTRLELNRMFHPNDAHCMQILLKHNFKNLLTKSDISVKSEVIGRIYFSLSKP